MLAKIVFEIIDRISLMRAKKQTNEENVKIKVILPILKQVLGYNDSEFDFEKNVRHKHIDIAILYKNKPKIIVEIKKLDEKLDRHIDQALEYAYSSQIRPILLTNGTEFRLYLSFAEGITNPQDRMVFKIKLNEIIDKYAIFSTWLHKDIIKTETKFNKTISEMLFHIRESVNIKSLTENMLTCRELIFTNIYNRYIEQIRDNPQFKSKLAHWCEEINIEKTKINDDEFIKSLCYQGAYTLFNRILFYRICSDLGYYPKRLSPRENFEQWKKLNKDYLISAFLEIAETFDILYNLPLFDSIFYKDIEWDQITIDKVIENLDFDFKTIKKDILGLAYQNHISKEERKKTGSYYTHDEIINYIFDSIPFNKNSKILDPSCGSGGFLTCAYDRIKNLHGSKEDVHKEILENNIFGIDNNPFAVQLTIINLLLKDLECPIHKINNIRLDDALIPFEHKFEYDIYVQDLFSNIKSVDNKYKDNTNKNFFKLDGFDIVVGNPPYGATLNKEYKNEYVSGKEVKNNDTYLFFLERAMRLCKDKGYIGYLIPDTILRKPDFEPIRNLLLKQCQIKQIIELGPIFSEAKTTHNIILIAQRKITDKFNDLEKVEIIRKRLNKDTSIEDRLFHLKNRNWHKEGIISQKEWLESPNLILGQFIEKIYFSIIETINKNIDWKAVIALKNSKKPAKPCVLLGHLPNLHIFRGIEKAKDCIKNQQKSNYEKTLLPEDIEKFKINYKNRYLPFYDNNLSVYKNRPSYERRNVYVIRIRSQFLKNRIICGMKPDNDTNYYFPLKTVQLIGFIEQCKNISLEYLMAILNSTVINFYATHYISDDINKEYLERLPIPYPDELTLKEVTNKVRLVIDENNKDKMKKMQEDLDNYIFNLYGLVKKSNDIKMAINEY